MCIACILSVYSGHVICGHFAIAENFRGTSRIIVKLSCKNPYIAKTFIADNYFCGHNCLTPLEKIKQNLPLYSGHPKFFKGK